MRIFITPGHPPDVNVDPGAINSRLGLQESVIAAKIGNRVAKYLAAVGYEVKVFQNDSLQDICDEANAWSADLFVSIHCNAANGNARGTETFYSRYSDAGHRLAECINQQLIDTIDSGCSHWNRGAKPANYYVLTHTDIPAVLVETAFIDNDDDARLLVEREDDFARAIARGITDITNVFN